MVVDGDFVVEFWVMEVVVVMVLISVFVSPFTKKAE